jgi:hypothetical protein
LAATEYERVPGPEPESLPDRVTQGTDDAAFQAHPAGAVTDRVPVPPEPLYDSDVGETENALQLVGAVGVGEDLPHPWRHATRARNRAKAR